MDFSAPALARVLFSELKLSPTARFTLAFSGGLDSNVLLHALARLRESGALEHLSAIHVHHGLQTEADRWAIHCAEVCHALSVPLVVERVSVVSGTEGIEAAARTARYTALSRHIGADDVLLTAHHEDDQAETVLLQLLRGTGVSGIAAMPMVDRFAFGLRARPLLRFGRDALRHYAEAHHLRWVEDPMNVDPRHARSFLRNEVFPLLHNRWPGVASLLARQARQAAENVQLLAELAETDLVPAIAGPCELAVGPLVGLSSALRRNALRHWLKQSGFKTPSALHLAQLDQIVTTATRSRHALLHWPGAEVRRYRDTLYVMKPLPPPERFCREWRLPESLLLPQTGQVLYATHVTGRGLSQARLANRIIEARARIGGERCSLPGRGMHELKKLLQEEGVPPWERARMPLIYVEGQLAAIADRFVCEPFAAKEGEAGWAVTLVQET